MNTVPIFGREFPNDARNTVIGVPQPVCFLRIDPGTRLAWFAKPNAWRRFWYWALLGWRFEPSETGDER